MPVVMPLSNRAAGTFATPEVDVPARALGEATRFIITVDLNTAALNDTLLMIDTLLEGSVDGTNWMLLAQIEGWQGGTVGRNGLVNPPRLTWAASNNRLLTKARASWTQNRAARSGLSVDMETKAV